MTAARRSFAQDSSRVSSVRAYVRACVRGVRSGTGQHTRRLTHNWQTASVAA